jgi:hypothetical protein
MQAPSYPPLLLFGAAQMTPSGNSTAGSAVYSIFKSMAGSFFFPSGAPDARTQKTKKLPFLVFFKIDG